MSTPPATLRFRPKPLSGIVRREVVAALLPGVLEWMARRPIVPVEEREVPDAPTPEEMPGVLAQALYARDGYRIARWLEDIHFMDPDAELVAILAAAPVLLAASYARAWQQWLADNHLGPLPPGTRVLYSRYLNKGPATVLSNDETAGEAAVRFDVFADLEGSETIRWEHLQVI